MSNKRATEESDDMLATNLVVSKRVNDESDDMLSVKPPQKKAKTKKFIPREKKTIGQQPKKVVVAAKPVVAKTTPPPPTPPTPPPEKTQKVKDLEHLQRKIESNKRVALSWEEVQDPLAITYLKLSYSTLGEPPAGEFHLGVNKSPDGAITRRFLIFYKGGKWDNRELCSQGDCLKICYCARACKFHHPSFNIKPM